MSHAWLLFWSPTQGRPPKAGFGSEHVLDSSCVPFPQVTEQVEDTAQEDQPPFTEKKVYALNICYRWSMKQILETSWKQRFDVFTPWMLSLVTLQHLHMPIPSSSVYHLLPVCIYEFSNKFTSQLYRPKIARPSSLVKPGETVVPKVSSPMLGWMIERISNEHLDIFHGCSRGTTIFGCALLISALRNNSSLFSTVTILLLKLISSQFFIKDLLVLSSRIIMINFDHYPSGRSSDSFSISRRKPVSLCRVGTLYYKHTSLALKLKFNALGELFVQDPIDPLLGVVLKLAAQDPELLGRDTVLCDRELHLS